MLLLLPNGKKVKIDEYKLRIYRDRCGVVVRKEKGGYAEELILGVSDDYVSQYNPSIGKFGSAVIRVEGKDLVVEVPQNATNPVIVDETPLRRVHIEPGEVARFHLDNPIQLKVGSKFYTVLPEETSSPGKRRKLFVYSSNSLREIRRLFVIGDIHGDFSTLQKIISKLDFSEDAAIFLGDYADRGSNGMEVIETVERLLEKYPEKVVALKGNHEDYTEDGLPKFSPCTLRDEVKRKGESWNMYFRNKFKPFVEKLYLAALIPNQYLFVHGGISSKIRSESDLQNPSPDIEEDILWSDPIEAPGEYFNKRGAGVAFGWDVTEEICRRLGVKGIIRSHQPAEVNGRPYLTHHGKVITTSATSVYGTRPILLIIEPGKFPYYIPL